MLSKRSNNCHLSFTNKCLSLPVVNSTCYWLNSSYNRFKCKNILIKYTMDLAESTVKTSIQLASPFVEIFKDKVNVIDELACHQLDRLEAAFPIITQEPNKIVDNGKKYLNEKVQPAVDRLTDLKNTKDRLIKNLELKKEEYDRLVWQATRRLLDLSEKFIEDKFQESIYGSNLSIESNDNLVKRAKFVTNLLYVSVQRKCYKQVNHLIKIVDRYLIFLIKCLEFVEKQKELITNRLYERIFIIKNLVGIYKEYLIMICKQLLVQDGRSIYSVNVSFY
jgi:ElaB/YqjD/DUF883 family membrane-anchored ribosome-binding protein